MKIPHQLINWAKEKIDSLVTLGLKNRNNRLTSAVMASLVPVLIWFLIHYKFPSRGRYAMVYHENISWWKLVFIITISITILSIAFYSLLKLAKRNVIYTQRNKHNKRYSTLLIQPIRQLSLLVIIPFTIILSLLLIDLIAMMLIVSPKVLYGGDYDFLPKLYFGAFAILGFSVSAYVAFVRHQSLKNSERQFDHAQKQFEYMQQQDLEEEIEKHFQEGVKLLGDESESVRIGGIYILSNILDQAIKAFPYVENQGIFYQQTKDIIIPYIKKDGNNLSDSNNEALKQKYKQSLKHNKTQINSYIKAFSLYTKVANILQSHLAIKTNSKDYIDNYIPSSTVNYLVDALPNQKYGVAGSLSKYFDEHPSKEVYLIIFLLFVKVHYHNQILMIDDIEMPTSFSNIIGGGLSLVNVNLTGIGLENFNFYNTYFMKSNLTDAFIKNTIFYQCYFSETNFSSAEIRKTCFHHTKIEFSIFIATKFVETSFKETPCIQSNLSGAFIYKTQFDEINKCELHGLNSQPGYSITFADDNVNNSFKSNGIMYPITANNWAHISNSSLENQPNNINEVWRISISDIDIYISYYRNINKNNYVFCKLLKSEYINNGFDKNLIFSARTFPDQVKLTEIFIDFDDFPIEENNDNSELES